MIAKIEQPKRRSIQQQHLLSIMIAKRNSIFEVDDVNLINNRMIANNLVVQDSKP